jgi:hypothetical protein
MLDATHRQRLRRLGQKFVSSPVLPALGVTKLVETLVAGGPTANWLAFTGLATLAFVFGDELEQAVDEATDAD